MSKKDSGSKNERSRYITKPVSDEVKSRDHFECAWCGVKLTERHHIKEFNEGGGHTVENLILLCPTCHTQYHNRDINKEDIVKRQSSHKKGDRISGSLQFDLSQPKIKLGGALFVNRLNPISFHDHYPARLYLEDGSYYLSTSFFDKNGDLIFWMSKNRFWTTKAFRVTFEDKILEIIEKDNPDYYLKIHQEHDYLCIEGKYYANGELLEFDPEKITIDGTLCATEIYGFTFTYSGEGYATNPAIKL